MTTGQIVSAAGHLCLLLWAVLGDWLFSPSDMPEVTVAEVSLMSSSEFDELVKASPAPAPTEPAQEPVEQPAEPVTPPEPVATDPVEPPPVVEDIPEDVPVSDAPQPIETPDPVAPIAETEQPVPVVPSDVKPKPRPVDRVAAVPVDSPTDAPDVADVATPEASDQAAPDAPVVEQEPPAAPEEATTQIVTEAVETEENAPQLPAMASLPPRSRPKDLIKPEEPPEEQAASADPAPEEPAPDAPTEDAVADAIAAAVADATDEPAQETADTGAAAAEANAPSGPPMTGAETDAMRVAVQACWNVGALSMEALRTTVIVGVSVNPDGKPDAASIKMVSSQGGGDVATGQAFEAARRAIIRCGSRGFPLPQDKYDQWKELELVFDPNGMRMR